MTESANLKGDDWVLVKDDEMVLDMDKKPMVFPTKQMAAGFRHRYGLHRFEAVQVSTLQRH